MWMLFIEFFAANVGFVLLFAVMYWAFGEDCFMLSNDFDFRQMVFLSIHTFTTVGYGTDSPGDCNGPQYLVFLEHFLGLAILSVFTAVFISQLLQPSPKVRFSDKYLIADEDNGKWLTFRFVRVSDYELRDAELSIQIGILKRQGAAITSCKDVRLPLDNPFKSNLDTWFVRHRIDEKSPLHGKDPKDIAFLNVTLKLFDTAFQQEVRMTKNYVPSTDCELDAEFESMKFWRDLTSAAELPEDDPIRETTMFKKKIPCIYHFVDHSRLNLTRKLTKGQENGKSGVGHKGEEGEAAPSPVAFSNKDPDDEDVLEKSWPTGAPSHGHGRSGS
jgi:hypothetical protein